VRVLIISYTDLAKDQRVNRQIRFVAEEHQVTAIGRASPKVPGVNFIPVSALPRSLISKALAIGLRLAGQPDESFWSLRYGGAAITILEQAGFDVIIANDLQPLPLALRLAQGRPVVFDAHEYFPRRFEDRLSWRLLRNPYSTLLCRRLIPRVTAMVTVCQGIAEAYERDTGVKPLVITNAPEYVELEPVVRRPSEPVRMVYHGMAHPSRRIEETIGMMRFLDRRFALDMYLVPGDPAYIQHLRKLAAADPRIRMQEPMPASEIVARTHGYDLGVFLLPPTSFSYRHALPNKFFEYIQARMAVAIGPSPEMARVVQAHGLGVVSEDFTAASLGTAINALDHETINRCKWQAHAVAYQYSAAANKAALLALLRQTSQAYGL